jgi:hypothetical protein
MARVIVQVKLADVNGDKFTEGEMIREFTIVSKGRGSVNISDMAAQVQYHVEGTEKFTIENIKTFEIERKRHLG